MIGFPTLFHFGVLGLLIALFAVTWLWERGEELLALFVAMSLGSLLALFAVAEVVMAADSRAWVP